MPWRADKDIFSSLLSSSGCSQKQDCSGQIARWFELVSRLEASSVVSDQLGIDMEVELVEEVSAWSSRDPTEAFRVRSLRKSLASSAARVEAQSTAAHLARSTDYYSCSHSWICFADRADRMGKLASLAREFVDFAVRNSSPSAEVAGSAVTLANRLANRNCFFPMYMRTTRSNGTSETSNSTCANRRTSCHERRSAAGVRTMDAKGRFLGGDRQHFHRRLEG